MLFEKNSVYFDIILSSGYIISFDLCVEIHLHFRHWRKLRFADLKPSAVTFVRVAFDGSNFSSLLHMDEENIMQSYTEKLITNK